MSEVAAPVRIDARTLAPRDRHPTIFLTFRGLAANEAMELLNDHDPRPLFHAFQAEAPGRFKWEYLDRGPETWRVRITRLGDAHANGSCCGACGGA